MSVYQKDLSKLFKTLLLKYETNVALNPNIDKKLDRFSIIEIMILEYLFENESMTSSELLNKMKLKRSKFLGITKKLVTAGYIEKKKSDIDKRSSILTLSKKGKSILKSYYEEENEFLDFVLADMTINEEKTIIKFLSKINQTKHMK